MSSQEKINMIMGLPRNIPDPNIHNPYLTHDVKLPFELVCPYIEITAKHLVDAAINALSKTELLWFMPESFDLKRLNLGPTPAQASEE